MKEEQERVYNLLKDTIILLCKNGLTFQNEVTIEGLLGVRVDQKDVFFLHMSETSSKLVSSNTLDSDPTKNSEITCTDVNHHKSSPKDCHYDEKQWIECNVKVKEEKDCYFSDVEIKAEIPYDYDCSIINISENMAPEYSSHNSSIENPKTCSIPLSKMNTTIPSHSNFQTLSSDSALPDDKKLYQNMGYVTYSNDSSVMIIPSSDNHWSSFKEDYFDSSQSSQNEVINSPQNFNDSSDVSSSSLLQNTLNNDNQEIKRENSVKRQKLLAKGKQQFQDTSANFNSLEFDGNNSNRNELFMTNDILNNLLSCRKRTVGVQRYQCTYPGCKRMVMHKRSLRRHEVLDHGRKIRKHNYSNDDTFNSYLS